jgi:DNA-binding MarR family transcriptional regulator
MKYKVLELKPDNGYCEIIAGDESKSIQLPFNCASRTKADAIKLAESVISSGDRSWFKAWNDFGRKSRTLLVANYLMSQNHSLSANDIVTHLDIKGTTIADPLKNLLKLGLVERTRDNDLPKNYLYSISERYHYPFYPALSGEMFSLFWGYSSPAKNDMYNQIMGGGRGIVSYLITRNLKAHISYGERSRTYDQARHYIKSIAQYHKQNNRAPNWFDVKVQNKVSPRGILVLYFVSQGCYKLKDLALKLNVSARTLSSTLEPMLEKKVLRKTRAKLSSYRVAKHITFTDDDNEQLDSKEMIQCIFGRSIQKGR